MMTVEPSDRLKSFLSALGCVFVIALLMPPSSAMADEEFGRITLTEENDYFGSDQDRHYTQGARLSYLSGQVTANGFWDQPFGLVQDNLPVFDGANRKRKYEWTIVGQSLFTPIHAVSPNPQRKDQPFGAWLYTGASLLQDTDHGGYHTLENMELLGGVVGPLALGDLTQNTFHQMIGTSTYLGWKNQIHNEPGLMLTYERKWRFQQPIYGNLGVDVIPELGATIGNIMTYGQTSAMVRFGQNLGADYGPNRIRPSLSGTGWFDGDQLNGQLGWYLFAGAQGRAVGHNVFIEGNTFRSSIGLDAKPLVADFVAGASLFWSAATRLDFTWTQRTKEFYDQRGSSDRFGAINLVVGF